MINFLQQVPCYATTTIRKIYLVISEGLKKCLIYQRFIRKYEKFNSELVWWVCVYVNRIVGSFLTHVCSQSGVSFFFFDYGMNKKTSKFQRMYLVDKKKDKLARHSDVIYSLMDSSIIQFPYMLRNNSPLRSFKS